MPYLAGALMILVRVLRCGGEVDRGVYGARGESGTGVIHRVGGASEIDV